MRWNASEKLHNTIPHPNDFMGNGNVDDHVVWNVIDHDKGIDVRLDSHHIIGKVVELPNISSNIKVIQTRPPFSLKEKKSQSKEHPKSY